MPFSNINNDNILFSFVEDITDEFGKDHFVEIRINKIYLKNIMMGSNKHDFIFNLKNKFSVTKREAEILSCIAVGDNNEEIAQKLHVSVHTAKAHIQNIFKKMCVTDRTEAVVKAIKNELINIYP